jgi:YVTN family beta-propeller protein
VREASVFGGANPFNPFNALRDPTNFGPVLRPLVWAANELQYQLMGLTPVAEPIQLPQSLAQTTVAGLLNASAPFGNPVTFTVVEQPASGTVKVDSSGSFVYTPDGTFAAAGGTDSFTVELTDAGRHLGGLLGVPGHSARVPVTITVTPTGTTETYPYKVWNYSSLPIQLSGYEANQASLYPAAGSEIAPGDYALFELDSGMNAVVRFDKKDTTLPIDWTTTAAEGLDFDDAPTDIAITPDGTRAYVSIPFGPVKVIDTATNTVTATITLPGEADLYDLLAITPNGSRVWVADSGYDLNPASGAISGGRVVVIDTATNTVSATLSNSNLLFPYGIAFSPDSTRAYVTAGSKLQVIDTATLKFIASIGVGRDPRGVTVSPDGQFVYVADYSGTVYAIDTYDAFGGPVGISAVKDPASLAMSPDGAHLYVGSYIGDTNNFVSVIATDPDNASYRQITETIDIGGFPTDIAVSPDGTRLYVTQYGGGVSVIDTTSSTVIARATTPNGSETTAAVATPDGGRVYLTWQALWEDYTNLPQGSVLMLDSATNMVHDYYQVTLGSTAGCEYSSGPCSVSGGDIYLLDPAGTVVTVPPDQAQAQSDLLGTLCNADASNCTFETQSEATIGWSDTHIPTDYTVVTVMDVPGATPASTTYKITDTATQTSSWQYQVQTSAELSLKLGAINTTAKKQWQTTTGVTVTDTHTYEQDVQLNIAVGYSAYIFGINPVYRFFGDWQLVLGNTTWNLTEVWYDTPYVAGAAQYVIDYCSFGSQECSEWAMGEYPESVLDAFPQPIYDTDASQTAIAPPAIMTDPEL